MSLIIQGIANIINIILTLYTYVIIASVILSWVNADPNNPIIQLINKLTVPLYNKIRSYMNRWFGQLTVIDLSPFILLLLIYFLQTALVGNLFKLAHNIKF